MLGETGELRARGPSRSELIREYKKRKAEVDLLIVGHAFDSDGDDEDEDPTIAEAKRELAESLDRCLEAGVAASELGVEAEQVAATRSGAGCVGVFAVALGILTIICLL